jgi:four helix bundle protein
MQDFRNIEVWQVSHDLTLDVYEVTASFPPHELYGLTSQLRRACSSIPTNIAEGCARGSDADFARFLYHAVGSASEVEYLVLLCRDLGYISPDEFDRLISETQRSKRMLASFIRRLNGSSRQPTANSR